MNMNVIVLLCAVLPSVQKPYASWIWSQDMGILDSLWEKLG
jgi:hypothetical protein